MPTVLLCMLRNIKGHACQIVRRDWHCWKESSACNVLTLTKVFASTLYYVFNRRHIWEEVSHLCLTDPCFCCVGVIDAIVYLFRSILSSSCSVSLALPFFSEACKDFSIQCKQYSTNSFSLCTSLFGTYLRTCVLKLE